MELIRSMTTKPTTKIFNYLRGALRGAYGVEDFRGKSVLIIGVNSFGQALVSNICFDEEVNLYFQVDEEQGLGNYLNAFSVCALVEPWSDQPVDIIVDTLTQKIIVDNTTISFGEIGEDSYTQGIHDFFC
jgi:hypothetical protein